VKLRAAILGLALFSGACGGEEDPDSEPGLETGPCLSGQQCAAGLVCASDVCVDLSSDGSGDDGSSPAPGDTPGSASRGDTDAPTPDDGTAGGDPDPDAGGDADAGDEAPDPSADGADASDDAGAGGWCPVPPAALSCTTACDLFQYECYECPHEAGDLCTYYDYQYDACLTGCEYTKMTPGDFTYEVFACRQYAGNDCGDAHTQCVLEIDCEGA
jgi:hypothetical protein